MAKTKEEHVKDSEEQTAEETQESPEELEALSEEETVEKVSELLKDEQTETTEEQPEEVVETEETPEEVEVPVPMIDDEFVKKYPATKTHYGKPVTDLGQSYQSIVKEFYDNSKELSEVKKKLAEATIPKLEDEPDPVEKPEEHKKWTKEREEAIRADERSKVADKPAQVDYVAEVAKQLPDDIDVNKVIESWEKAFAYKLYDNKGVMLPEMRLLYQNKPHILVREVVDHYKLSEQANKTDEDVRKAAHTELKGNFKKARKEKKNIPGSEVHVVERESKVSESEEQLQRLHKIVQEDNS